jgi:hypothetical protein
MIRHVFVLIVAAVAVVSCSSPKRHEHECCCSRNSEKGNNGNEVLRVKRIEILGEDGVTVCTLGTEHASQWFGDEIGMLRPGPSGYGAVLRIKALDGSDALILSPLGMKAVMDNYLTNVGAGGLSIEVAGEGALDLQWPSGITRRE